VDAINQNTKFGPPIEEVFGLRPKIAMTVSHGDNRQICKLEFRPTQDDVVTPLAMIDELVIEIIPPSMRGKPGRANGIVCAGFCMKFGDCQDFWLAQAGQEVKVLVHRIGEERMWLAVVQFKSYQGELLRDLACNSIDHLTLVVREGRLTISGRTSSFQPAFGKIR
jgi:hypothetical protein